MTTIYFGKKNNNKRIFTQYIHKYNLDSGGARLSLHSFKNAVQ